MAEGKSRLAGKVVWLTGASSGLGEACARELAKTGCKLVLSARRVEVLEVLVKELGGVERGVMALPCDVSNKAEVRQRAVQIERQFGAVEVLIANAGSHIPTDVTAFDCDQYKSIMDLNFFGALYCIESVLPKMIERKQGHLVCVSSVAGYRGLPNAAAYGASKAALTHFLESIRFDLIAHNVDVSVVSPGFIRTPLTDKNDFPMPFLMESDAAAQVMVSGIEQRLREVHFPKKFTWMMKFLRVIPFPLYHRIIVKNVLKK